MATISILPAFSETLPEVENLDRTEIERLRSKNPVYELYEPEWKLYLAAYEGGKSITNRHNVFRHQRENEEDYEDRLKRLHYINYCGPLVDFFTSFIFTETIDRKGGPDQAWFDEFSLDVDKKGTTLNDYMRDVSDDIQIFGMSYTLVDTPSVPDDAPVLSRYDEEARNIRPYWVLMKPLEVTDWVTDEFESYTYLKRKQLIHEIDNGVRKAFEKFTEFYTDKVEVNYIEVTSPTNPVLRPDKAATFVNKLGKIPVSISRYKRSKEFSLMGNGFLRDLAYNNREVMNLTSLLQEFLYRQCFNLLAKETDGALPMTSAEDGNLGQSNVMEFPKGAHPPSYISPPADPANFLQSERQRIVNEMYRNAAQDTMNELFNGGKSSGFSQAQSFSKTVPFIATRADTLQATEITLLSLTLEYIGKPAFSGRIKYKDRYELTNLTDVMTQLTMVFRDLFIPSETFVKEELKRLVREMDDKIAPPMMKKIEAEIEAMNFSEWQTVQESALIGRGVSPAAQQKPKSTGTIAEFAAESANDPAVGATKALKGKG